MERAKHEMPGFRCGQRQADSLLIAQLPHQDNIGVFTQSAAQRIVKTMGIAMHFSLVNQTFITAMDKLNRVFDR